MSEWVNWQNEWIIFTVFVLPLQFLAASTARLELGSYGRILYDWDGKEVKDLEEGGKLWFLCLSEA